MVADDSRIKLAGDYLFQPAKIKSPTTMLDLDCEDLVGPTFFQSRGCFQKQKRHIRFIS
jgi:hypothetical protein